MKDIKKKGLSLYKKAKKATKEYYDFQMENSWTEKIELVPTKFAKQDHYSYVTTLQEDKEMQLGVKLDQPGIYKYFNEKLFGSKPIYIGMSEVNLYNRTNSFVVEIVRCFNHYQENKDFEINLSESHSKKFVKLCVEKGLNAISELENTYVQYCPGPSDFSLDFEKLSIDEFRDRNNEEAPILNVMR